MAIRGMPLTPEAIGAVYESVLDPNGLEGIAAVIGKIVKVDTVGFWLLDRSGVVDWSGTGDLQESNAPYQAYFHKFDFWAAGTMRHPGEVKIGYEVFPERELVKTEFYNDFARRFDLFRPMGAMLPVRRGVFASIGVHRRGTKHLFEERDKQPLQQVLPHLRQALQLRLRRQQQGVRSEWSLAALDAVAFGVVICDAAGRIRHANAAARALAAEGAGITLGRSVNGVSAMLVGEARALAALIDAAAHGRGGAIRLTGRSGRHLLVLATPLPSGLGEQCGVGHIMLALRREAEAPPLLVDRLMALFRLSPAQAALCVALLDGKTFKDVADERDVKISTLRTHLAKALQRTGARSARDLVRIVGSLPPLR